MDTLALLVGVLLCLTVVNGRSFERHDNDPLSVIDDGAQRSHSGELRHRRKRWQTNYGYEYPTPMAPYYPERRDYDRNNQELLVQIVRLLEQIENSMRRPPPPPMPPQPIYISYPVPYPMPQYTPCPTTPPNKVNITNRFPEMEDTNQNWGFALNEEDNNKFVGDGSRPISFDPIKPKRPLTIPPPNVEHGSVQDSSASTLSPKFDDSQVPVMCNAAILSCCADNKQQRDMCFNNFGCSDTYDNGRGCSTDSLNRALEAFKVAYSPMP